MATSRPTASELRAMPEHDLAAQLDTLRQESWSARLKMKEGALQQTHGLRAVRRQIARVSTILRERRTT